MITNVILVVLFWAASYTIGLRTGYLRAKSQVQIVRLKQHVFQGNENYFLSDGRVGYTIYKGQKICTVIRDENEVAEWLTEKEAHAILSKFEKGDSNEVK